MPYLLPPVRAVQLGRLIQPRIDGRYDRAIQNTGKTEALPHIRERIDPRECVCGGAVILRLRAEKCQQVGNQAIDVDERNHHTYHYHGGNEIRHVAGGLHEFLEPGMAYLIQQQREQDRRRETEEQVQHAQDQGIPDEPEEIVACYESLEPLKAYPFHTFPKKRSSRNIVLKSNHDSVHGDVAEDKY